MRLPSGQRSTEWVKRLPAVVAALNGEVTRLTGKRPSDAIKAKTVAQKPSSVVPDRPVGLKEQRLPSDVGVRYLYQPGELEGGRLLDVTPTSLKDRVHLRAQTDIFGNGAPCTLVLHLPQHLFVGDAV